jgi:hypothetical protein
MTTGRINQVTISERINQPCGRLIPQGQLQFIIHLVRAVLQIETKPSSLLHFLYSRPYFRDRSLASNGIRSGYVGP